MFVPRLVQTLDHVLYLELKFVQNFLLHTEKKKHIFKEYIISTKWLNPLGVAIFGIVLDLLLSSKT